MTAVLAGLGSWLPPRVVNNQELTRYLDTSDEWIRTRTGIHERRIADPGTSTVDMAIRAAAEALRHSGDAGADALVLATSTADHLCPAGAPRVAAALGLSGIPAFDVNAACTGFVYALAVAAGMIAAGLAGRVVVVGADVFSRLCDPADRATAPLFGDGAGAVVVRAGSAREPGALGPFDLHSAGEHTEMLFVPAGGSRLRASDDPRDHFLKMRGNEVFRHACTRMAESALAVLAAAGIPVSGLDRLVGHQANSRILEATAKRLRLAPDRLVITLGRTGNTSAASIPLALAAAARAGNLQAGQRVLLTAFGAGTTWGSALLTWPTFSRPPDPS